MAPKYYYTVRDALKGYNDKVECPKGEKILVVRCGANDKDREFMQRLKEQCKAPIYMRLSLAMALSRIFRSLKYGKRLLTFRQIREAVLTVCLCLKDTI